LKGFANARLKTHEEPHISQMSHQPIPS
jgi:hypothetical protein